jgi:Tfp pilus assembly protein PilW
MRGWLVVLIPFAVALLVALIVLAAVGIAFFNQR